MPARRLGIVCLAGVLLGACTGDGSGSSDAGGDPPPGDGFDAFMVEAIADIDQFWAANFASVSTTGLYSSPARVLPYEPGTLPSGGCGLANEDPMKWIDNAFHCGDDHLIAYDRNFFRTLFEEQGEFAPIAIMAHEWGHHVQTLAGAPTFSMQRELQADCYAGIYASDADARGLFGDSNIRDAVVTFFSQGDKNYSETTWFDPRVHGPAHERALATGSGVLTDDVAYCENYGDYAPRDPLALGTYSLYVPAALAFTEEGELTRIEGPHSTGFVKYQPSLSGTDAMATLPIVAPGWFGSGWTPLEEPHGGGIAAVFGGTSALQAYEWAFTDANGAPAVQHGVLLLLMSGNGDGLLIDVARPGRAPELTAENLQPIADYLYLLAWGVCPPSGLAWACEPAG